MSCTGSSQTYRGGMWVMLGLGPSGVLLTVPMSRTISIGPWICPGHRMSWWTSPDLIHYTHFDNISDI